MPKTGTEIVRILAVKDVGDDVFLGRHPDSSALAKTYGGQMVAQAVAAAARTVDAGRPVHAVQSHFYEPGRRGSPILYKVERIREGRSFSQREVRGTQDGRPVIRVLASFQAVETGLAHQPDAPSDTSPQTALPLHTAVRERSALEHDQWRDEWPALDLRHDDSPCSTPGTGPGAKRLWIRVRDRLPDDPALHRTLIVYLSDLTLLATALLPHGFFLGDPQLPRASLNHSVWLHSATRADEWLLIDQRSPWAGAGRGLSFASVYDRSGRHAATFAQEGLIRPVGALRRDLGLAD